MPQTLGLNSGMEGGAFGVYLRAGHRRTEELIVGANRISASSPEGGTTLTNKKRAQVHARVWLEMRKGAPQSI